MPIGPAPALTLVLAAIYLAGLGPAPRDRAGRSARRLRTGSLLTATVVLLIATGWPVDDLATRYQWAHMLQHVLLIGVAAPLLVLARPWLAPMHVMPRAWRGPVARFTFRDPRTRAVRRTAALLALPAVAFVVFHGTFALFHVPAVYTLALHDPIVHAVEHGLLLGTAALFWWVVMRLEGPTTTERVAYLVASGFAGSMLGLWLITAPPLYGYAGTAGLSPMTDQRLAAGVMGAPGAIVIAVAAGALIFRWLGEQERADRHAIAAGGPR